MATIISANGKRITLSIEEKAHALRVLEIGEDGRLAVPSGTDSKTAYVVQHNGRYATYCPCGAYGPRCAHKIAANWYLEAQRRAAYEATFDLSFAGDAY